MPKIVGSIPLVSWLSCPFLLRAWVFSICVRGFNASYEAGALLRKGSIPMEFLDTPVFFFLFIHRLVFYGNYDTARVIFFSKHWMQCDTCRLTWNF